MMWILAKNRTMKIPQRLSNIIKKQVSVIAVCGGWNEDKV